MKRKRPEPSVRVVGIGASAGGVEALQQFFGHVPANPGLAFVVIHHRDPTHRGMLDEIIQRATALPVAEATQGCAVRPNRVYLNPPNRDVSLARGHLHLAEPTAPRGLGLPIDLFFRSLAEDQGDRAIGVILSGMGSDGTLGLRAITEKAGAAFVQAPRSAKFDAMPRSVIESGLADVVAPAEELAQRIVSFASYATGLSVPDLTRDAKHPAALDRIFSVLRSATGNDFSLYKTSTILRRVERRMGIHQIDSLEHYLDFLRKNPSEADILHKELLIGVTSFFRDAAAWDALKEVVIAPLVRSRRGGAIRAWVIGGSTGEEAFSLAISIKEAIEHEQGVQNVRVKVFATDLDRDAIEKARAGVYPMNITADVSPERLSRFFSEDDRGYRVSKEIREMVVFAPQNVTVDPPFTKVDIIACRNLLIYFAQELQKKLIPLFHYSLNPGGALFLGNAETIGAFANLFVTEDQRARIYRRVEPLDVPTLDFPAAFTTRFGVDGDREEPSPKPAPNVQSLVERMMLDRWAPAAVLASAKGDILYISGRTGKFLEPPSGKVNWNVLAMAREGLRHDLSAAFAATLRDGRAHTVTGLEIRTDGTTMRVDLVAQKLSEPASLSGKVLLVLREAQALVPASRGEKKKPSKVLADELRRSRVETQDLREQIQTSEEELKSSNEELQSTNEELQSTNEELTTSKEELQSLNEELQTVNNELELKVDELSRSNNDMSNLLNSTDVATLFLDHELRVRRFTTQTVKLIKLIPSDVGRPITDIATNIDYPDLAADAREVLRTLFFRERLVRGGDKWFSVRVMPYRTLDDTIDGVVITFTDATGMKQLESSLRQQANQLRQLAESLPNLVFACHANGTCDYVNRQWVEYTGVPEADQLGHRWLEQVHEADREKLRREWASAVQHGEALDTEARIRRSDQVFRWFKIRAVPLRDDGGPITRWYGSCTDVDDLKRP